MPEQSDLNMDDRPVMEEHSASETQEVLGLTGLQGEGPLGAPLHGPPPATGGAALGTMQAEFAADPTLRTTDFATVVGRKWYQGLGWGFWVAVAYIVFWILLAVFASVLPLQSPDAIQSDCFVNAGISSAHWLGCDNIGRDILSRVVFGARVSLVVGFASIAFALVVGGMLGIVSGYFRGLLDDGLVVISNVFLAFPGLVLGLLIVSYLGHSEFNIVLIIAIVAWPLLYRVVRASTIEYSQREYVLAAQALGSTRSRILLKILLPDIIPTAITYGLVGVALAIVGEGALSFLGQSVAAPIPTWGNMIAQGSGQMPNYISLLFSPAVAMFTFILAINFIGDRMRSILDVRQGVL